MLTVSPLELRPAFSPSIHDYAVACSAGSNSLTLDAIAAPGGSVSLIAPFTTEPAASMTVTVQLNENAVAVVQATDASAVVEQYWIRCLPHDFPILSATRHPEAGSPTPGWYLMGNPFVAQGSGSYAMIVDANGTPVWYHLHPGGAVAVEPFPDTTVAVAPVLGPGFGTDPTRGFTLYHLDTGTREAVLTVGMPTDHHEILSLPNGDRMLLSYPLKTGVDLTGLRTYGPNSTIADCVVQEVDPADNLVWEWRASDHTDPVRESTAPSQVTVNGQPVVDVYHCNSIDVNAAGDVLVSARHLDSVFLISRATGTILWKLGGTAFNRDGAEILLILADPQIAFYRQHDARFQPNGDISLFDDHGAGSGPARGVEYELDLAGGTARLVWQYLGNATSSAMGSFRRYPDGDSVIGWGASTSSTHAAATEVDASGRDLLDLSFTSHGNWAYRAVKVPIDAFDINALRNTAGLP
jgi:arylsulfotransferase ASST